MSNPTRILSRPIAVRWAGWVSDTHTLQKFGWDLSVDEQLHNMSIRLAMQHRGLRVRGMSNNLAYDFF